MEKCDRDRQIILDSLSTLVNSDRNALMTHFSMTRYLPDSMPCGRNSAGTTNSGGPASKDDSGTSNPSYDRSLGADEGMELTLSSESLEIEVSAVHFLMELAQVAAQVYPWDNKVLESTRFKAGRCISLYAISSSYLEVISGVITAYKAG
tara:strand:- start:234 stop:683 length:450 start_codon:yes stop_codon:yes gene_type:complete